VDNQEEMSIAGILIKNATQLQANRSNYDIVNQTVSDYMSPNRGNFTVEESPGQRKDKKIYDPTANISAQRLASILHSRMTTPGEVWARIRPKNSQLLEKDNVKRFLDLLDNTIFDILNDSSKGFSQKNHEMLRDLVLFGTSVMWVEGDNRDIIFNNIHLSQIWIEENNKGIVDTIYRKFKMSVRQMRQEFGEDKLSREMLDLEKAQPHTKCEILHCVMPKKDYIRMSGKVSLGLELEDKKFVSVYISMKDKNILKIAGYRTEPFLVVRWEKRIGEIYGISPAWNVLSSAQMVNAFMEVWIKSEQKKVDPPLLISDDGVILPLETFPGGVNIGALSEDGQPLVREFPAGGSSSSKIEMVIETNRKDIAKGFFVDQFNPREGVQPLTATEDLHNQDKESQFIFPHQKRLEDEYLTQLYTKLVDIVLQNDLVVDQDGTIQELPEELIIKGKFDFNIQYVNSLTFTQKSNELLAYTRFFANAAPLIELDPSLIDNFNLDKSVRDIADKSGIALEQIRSPKEIEAIRGERAEAQQMERQKVDLIQGADAASKLQKSGINVIPE